MDVIKIAVIGAGSIGFTRRHRARHLCVSRSFRTRRVCASPTSASATWTWSTSCASATCEANGVESTITATLDRRAGAEGRRLRLLRRARRRAGGVPDRHRHPAEVRRRPVRGRHAVRRRHHVRASATIPAMLDFCKDIREVARARLHVHLRTQPHGHEHLGLQRVRYGVDTIGLCHGVEGGQRQIAERARRAQREEVDIICAGINHQTWYIQVSTRART